MKSGVNPEGPGQLEPIGDRVDPTNHLKRADEARSQLPGLHAQGQVFGGQPYPLAWAEMLGRPPATVGLGLGGPGAPQQRSAGLVPHPPAAPHVTLDRRNPSIDLLLWKQRGLEAELALEGRHPRCRRLQGVVSVFRPRQPGTPGRWIVPRQAPQGCLQVLIEPLRLPVRLRVEARGEAGRGPQESAERPPHLGCELWSPVRHNVLGKPEDSEDMGKD